MAPRRRLVKHEFDETPLIFFFLLSVFKSQDGRKMYRKRKEYKMQ